MKPSTLKTLRVLEDNESVTTHDFLVAGCGSRFGARIHELRELGYPIDEKRLSDRSGSRYRLLGRPGPVQPVSVAGPGEQAVLFEVPRRNHYEEAA